MKKCCRLLLPAVFVLFTANILFAARTELISRGTDGSVGDGKSEDPSISEDARYIVYESTAQNLVSGKTTSNRDVFLYDRITKTTTRVSLPPTGEGNSSSYDAEISADGSVIVFTSSASNLVSGDNGGYRDIFAYDRESGDITRVSVNSSGTAGDGHSDNADVSGDGRYIVFQSEASNLIDDDKNSQSDIFRHDRVTGTTILVNYNFLNEQLTGHSSIEPVISNDGRYVAFQSSAPLTPCDDNGDQDIFLRDLINNTTTLESKTYYGCVANNNSYHPSISADGRYIGFSSRATDLLIEDDKNSEDDYFVRDRQLEITERISVAGTSTESDGRSVGYGGNISSNGQYIVFSSEATTLAKDNNGGHDVYARDRFAKSTTIEGVGTYWELGTGDSTANTAVISANGKYIIFDSSSANLVPDDNNSNWDIFIRDYLWSGPLISSINPQHGDFKGGTLLTITGSNFNSNAAVTIDGQPALNVSVNAAGTSITCVTPPHAVGTVELQVTNADGSTWIYPIGRGVFNGYIYRPLSLPYLIPLLLNN